MTTFVPARTPPTDAASRASARPAPQEIDDDRLVQRHLEGDPRAFGALVDRYQSHLHQFITRAGEDRERAEELVQEVFVRVFRHVRRFDRTKSLSAWIYTIAANLARDNPRRRGRDPLLPSLE